MLGGGRRDKGQGILIVAVTVGALALVACAFFGCSLLGSFGGSFLGDEVSIGKNVYLHWSLRE